MKLWKEENKQRAESGVQMCFHGKPRKWYHDEVWETLVIPERWDSQEKLEAMGKRQLLFKCIIYKFKEWCIKIMAKWKRRINA